MIRTLLQNRGIRVGRGWLPDLKPGRPSARTPVRSAAVILLAGSMMLSGCYMKRPVDPATLQPDQEVVLELVPDSETRYSAQEAYPVQIVEGKILELGADTLWLETFWGRFADQRSSIVPSRIPVERRAVLQSQVKEFSLGRTAIAVLGGAFVLWQGLDAVGVGGSSKGSGKDPGGDPSPSLIRIPISLIRF